MWLINECNAVINFNFKKSNIWKITTSVHDQLFRIIFTGTHFNLGEELHYITKQSHSSKRFAALSRQLLYFVRLCSLRILVDIFFYLPTRMVNSEITNISQLVSSMSANACTTDRSN